MTTNRTRPATATCRRCRATLTAPASVAAGIGPRCAALEAAMAGLNGRQAAKALEVTELGGVVRTNRPGVWRVSATSGEESYLCTLDGHCACRWGLCRGTASVKPCYHVAAARLAARPRIRPAKAAGTAVSAPIALPAGNHPETAPDRVWALLEAVGALDAVPAF